MPVRHRHRGNHVRKEVVVAVALVILCTVTAISNPAFTKFSNLTNTTLQISMLGVIALGAGFVIITGGIDLSIGSLIGLTAVIVVKIAAGEHLGGMGKPLWMALVIGIGIATLLGLIQGLMVARLGLQPFIVTLGGMLCFKGVSQTITQGGSMPVNDVDLPALRNLRFQGPSFQMERGVDGFGEPLMDTYILCAQAIIFLAIAAVLAYLLHFTVFGRRLFAVGGNREAARYAGVPVKSVETSAYALSGFLAGVGGVLYASYSGDVSHELGSTFELYAIAAAVLGGCSLRGGEGTVVGIVLGAALFKILENGINMVQPVVDRAFPTSGFKLDNSRNIVIGAVILGAVLFDQATQAWRNYRQTRKKS